MANVNATLTCPHCGHDVRDHADRSLCRRVRSSGRSAHRVRGNRLPYRAWRPDRHLEHRTPAATPASASSSSGADYVYLVPFVEDEQTVFLKTIIPSRKATKQYLGEESDDEA